MTDLRIEVVPDVWLPVAQAAALVARAGELGHSHWHVNECGCCVTIHGHDCAYVIGPDGDADCFPGRGCDCPPDASGQMS
jgi:hypothetical protein